MFPHGNVGRKKVKRGLSPIQGYGDAETKFKPAFLHRCGARKKSGILTINTQIFFNSSARTGSTEQTYGEKKLGSPAILRFYFQKTTFSCSNSVIQKQACYFGQHFDGEPPRNLNHVFLRQFENGFNKKLACLCSKTKMTEPP